MQGRVSEDLGVGEGGGDSTVCSWLTTSSEAPSQALTPLLNKKFRGSSCLAQHLTPVYQDLQRAYRLLVSGTSLSL